MMFSALLALALCVVLGLAAWETWADLQEVRRQRDVLQARVDQQDYVIAELRMRIETLNRESDTHD